ncbi:MAG: glycosyltransferase [Candidatus Magasanikbacteria bacterium]|jgi:glycosyltransferase involved in cell wall biosynthesis|nr:glycosyltransferase [Candidatus Magasanikbacteria bacterium]MBT4314812.1 glycosyltransferase [Candidatus Magasanikbacteria bacterium]MBT4547589.1 glycosyltransferase [Candidatus Magasanikbacteria bacterium]MBT6818838.1 glycosyltransferase [Candidatus Magasanikbacteria bacterium]
MNNNITFVLFTYNEEKRISYAIRNFIKCGEVILMDGGSTDKTQEIAESLGARFLSRPPSKKPQVETQENFDFLKSNLNTDWIYWGYVDNIAPKSLVEKMIEISMQDKYKYVLVPLYTYLWGNTDNYIQKAYSPFLFHKDFINYKENYIHGMGQFLGSKDQKLKLPNKEKYALKHFSTYSINKFVIGHLRYAEAEAAEKYLLEKKFSIIRMLAAMLRYIWIYGKRGWRSGRLGIIIILSYAFFRLMAYARLFELENNITLESIEEKYSLSKEDLLKDFDS